MMRIAVIDADLIGRKRHRFPNLVCMKISGYHKDRGDSVILKWNYEDLDSFDKVYLAKVFTDTPVPPAILQRENLTYGGTGFFYASAPPLPEEIEHQMPDYHLYDEWVKEQLKAGKKRTEFRFYLDYSIGYLTRSCFRHCPFCVNQNYHRVRVASPLTEFWDHTRKKICLLDDNFLGHHQWKRMLLELRMTGRPFLFKQGLDERLLTPEKCEMLFSSRYDGDFMFAFDNLADAERIEAKIRLARQYTQAILKFYCFCGFDRADKWDADFWRQDIFDLFRRIKILMQHRCLPYIMRYNRYVESPYRGVYISIARWCNQPSFFKKKTLREFAELNGEKSACYRYLAHFAARFPEVRPYYEMRFPSCIQQKSLAITGQ